MFKLVKSLDITVAGSLYLINVYVYILSMLLFIFIFTFFKIYALKYVNQLSYLNILPSLKIMFLILFLSLAGVPPLAGFISKFLIFFFILKKTTFIFVSLFLIFNLCSIFFYLQNLKLLSGVSSLSSLKLVLNKLFITTGLIYFLVYLAFILIFFFFFIDSFYIIFSSFIIN